MKNKTFDFLCFRINPIPSLMGVKDKKCARAENSPPARSLFRQFLYQISLKNHMFSAIRRAISLQPTCFMPADMMSAVR